MDLGERSGARASRLYQRELPVVDVGVYKRKYLFRA